MPSSKPLRSRFTFHDMLSLRKQQGVLFSFFVKSTGDTIAVLLMRETSFSLWREGRRKGSFASMKDVIDYLDKQDW